MSPLWSQLWLLQSASKTSEMTCMMGHGEEHEHVLSCLCIFLVLLQLTMCVCLFGSFWESIFFESWSNRGVCDKNFIKCVDVSMITQHLVVSGACFRHARIYAGFVNPEIWRTSCHIRGKWGELFSSCMKSIFFICANVRVMLLEWISCSCKMVQASLVMCTLIVWYACVTCFWDLLSCGCSVQRCKLFKVSKKSHSS